MSPLPINCPIPSESEEMVTLAHGEGGRAARRFIEEWILPRLNSSYANELADAAVLPTIAGAPVLTTDSYVVSPLFFPGGDIGRLAIYGTVNDLVVAGARPLWISLSMIIEEGFAKNSLDKILDSVADAAKMSNVQVVTGDTKVVPRGAADGIFLTTTGLGEQIEGTPVGPKALKEGDLIIVSGPIGQHGIAILAAREELGFEPMPRSDCGTLWPAAQSLRAADCYVRAMRDATRGGVGAVLQEWAIASEMTMAIDEEAIPVSAEVRGACELLGLDPLHLPNEGTMLVAVPKERVEDALLTLRVAGNCPRAAVIARVGKRRSVPVFVYRGLGIEIPLEEPQGAPLPRIC